MTFGWQSHQLPDAWGSCVVYVEQNRGTATTGSATVFMPAEGVLLALDDAQVCLAAGRDRRVASDRLGKTLEHVLTGERYAVVAMGAQIGARDDVHVYDVPPPGLLRRVTGISVEAEGKHAFLEDAGYKTVQRLSLFDVGGAVLAGLSPGELKPHALRLYSDHRAERFVSAALGGGWSVHPNPHVAFFQAPVHQRLYLQPTIDLDQYVQLWEGSGFERIGGYWKDDLIVSLWPWLREHGCAKAEDDAVFGEFLQVLGDRRQAHLRPGLRAERLWPRKEVMAQGASLAADVRTGVNRVLQAIDEPRFPLGSSQDS